MALISCTDCGNAVSSSANACPMCGCSSSRTRLILGAAVGWMAGVIVAIFTIRNPSLDEVLKLRIMASVLVTAAPIGILGAIVGWATGRVRRKPSK